MDSDLLLTPGKIIRWHEGAEERSALWRSEGGQPPPRRVQVANDTAVAYRLACEGTALLWRGGFSECPAIIDASHGPAT